MNPCALRLQVGLVVAALLGAAWAPCSTASNQKEYRAAKATLRADGYQYTVNSGRPVFEIVQLLSDRTGVVINYEDAPIWYPDELDDVTAEVSQNPDSGRLRGGRPVLVPKNKAVTWEDRLSDRKPPLGKVQGALNNLIKVQNGRKDGGKYKVVRDSDVLHVVPMRTRTRSGQWRNVMSLMDVRISVPAEPRTVREQIRAILDATRDASRLTFVGIPFHPPVDFSVPPKTYVVDNITARQALLDVLQHAPYPTRWAALYDPLTQGYQVSFFVLPREVSIGTDSVEDPPLSPLPGPGPAATPPPP